MDDLTYAHVFSVAVWGAMAVVAGLLTWAVREIRSVSTIVAVLSKQLDAHGVRILALEVNKGEVTKTLSGVASDVSYIRGVLDGERSPPVPRSRRTAKAE